MSLLWVREHDQLKALLSSGANSTDGISEIEIRHLAWLGSQIPAGGDYVEIGSYRGKSVCAVGCGVRAAGKHGQVRLFAVDLWTKGSTRSSKFAHYFSEETWRIFNEQVAAMRLSDVVTPVMSGSLAAAKRRKRPIDLLFIDARHDYQYVKADFTAWEKFVPVGGRIAFHDYGSRFPGVDRVVREVIASRKWSFDGHVYGRIWSALRLEK